MARPFVDAFFVKEVLSCENRRMPCIVFMHYDDCIQAAIRV